MNSLINWFEIPVIDLDRAIDFYQNVMQITLQKENINDVEMAVFPYQPPATGGALVKFKGIKPSGQGCIIYLHTDNLAVTIERVKLAGGKCMLEPQELADDIGTIALIIDSEGNLIGLHQPK